MNRIWISDCVRCENYTERGLCGEMGKPVKNGIPSWCPILAEQADLVTKRACQIAFDVRRALSNYGGQRIEANAVMEQMILDISHILVDFRSPREEQEADVCEWKQDEETGSCSAKCGFAFYLEWDSPAQNGMVYCPRCGRKIKEVPNE